jgi:putative transposase
MSQSLADMILHIVFSTKGREPFIKPSIEEELYAFISGFCKKVNSPIIKINGVEDHVHILLSLGRTISVSKLVGDIKANSSRWIKTKGQEYNQFAWQAGYGVFSVSRLNINGPLNYIANQKKHHKKITFKEEYLMFLNKAQIQYEEKYLWD